MVGSELREVTALCFMETIAPGQAGRASAPFLHALPCKLLCKLPCHILTDVQCPVCLLWSLALHKASFYTQGQGLAAFPPGPDQVSSAAVAGTVGSWRVSQLPLRLPHFDKPSCAPHWGTLLCTLHSTRAVLLSSLGQSTELQNIVQHNTLKFNHGKLSHSL